MKGLMEQLLTLPEVSKILGSKDTGDCRFVRRLVRQGELNGTRIGKKLMFRESEINAYIEKKFTKK